MEEEVFKNFAYNFNAYMAQIRDKLDCIDQSLSLIAACLIKSKKNKKEIYELAKSIAETSLGDMAYDAQLEE